MGRASLGSRQEIADAMIAIMLFLDRPYTHQLYRDQDAAERSHRTPDEATRPSCPDGRRAGRQHEQSRRAAEHHATRDFQIDCRIGRCHRRPLLDRNPRGVEPTDYGRALLDGGTAMFDDLRQAMKNIEFLADPATGEVRIGCNPLLAASFVSAVVDRVSGAIRASNFISWPDRRRSLHRELMRTQCRSPDRTEIGPHVRRAAGFEFLYDDSYVVAAGAQNPRARRRRIELAELVNESWVLPPPESGSGRSLRKPFAPAVSTILV